jgi:hypothetical protein
MTEIDPRTALEEIDRVDRRVRRGRWWQVASALVMMFFSAVFYIGLKAYPGTADNLVLPVILLTFTLVSLIAWRQRVAGKDDKRLEQKAGWVSLGLAAVTVTLNWWVLPDGLSVWTVLAGLLPAIPFAVLAWRFASR